jgi:hypothetical protein
MNIVYKSVIGAILTASSLTLAFDHATMKVKKSEKVEASVKVCSAEQGTLSITNTGADADMDQQQIAREIVKCFHKNSKYKAELAAQMKELQPKQNNQRCQVEKDKQVMVLSSWDSGRPWFDSNTGEENPLGSMSFEKNLLIRQDIHCWNRTDTGLFSGIQAGVALKVKYTEETKFRIEGAGVDDSQVIKVELLEISK